MKVTVILLLFILFFSVFSPVTVHKNIKRSDTLVLLKLDICHTTDTLLIGSTGLPSLYESPDSPPGLFAAGILKTQNKTFISLLIPFREDKPPRA